VTLTLLIWLFIGRLLFPAASETATPRWYRPTVYNDYLDFYDAQGNKIGRLAYNAASSKAVFTSRRVALQFKTKGFYDGEIKIKHYNTQNKLGEIRRINRKRNLLVMSDGRTYTIDLKSMTVSEDDVVLLKFEEKNKNEFIVQSNLHNEQEMMELNVILMYGRIAWMFSGV
jgi:hypothetical protein